MKIAFIVLLALVGAAAAASVPQFPQSFSVVEDDTMHIQQGNYQTKGNLICCPAGGNCKVQVEQQAGNSYVDATNERSRFDMFGSDQSIYNDFKLGREYAIQNNTCQDWCPMQESGFPGFGIDPNATHVGNKVINNETCQDWQWKDKILGVIVMDINDMFFTVKDGKNIPVQQVQQLTPFGQPLGTSTSTWSNYVAGEPAASHFDIAGLKSCQKSPNCNQNSNDKFASMRKFNRVKWGLWKTWSYYEQGLDM